MWLGVDTGGTFTDFVLFDGEQLRLHKVLSTPDSPERAILQGIKELGITEKQLASMSITHGSTVATNAVLEGKGVKTLYITNRGFADLLTLGRQAREELFNLQPEKIAPPVPSELCHETGGRITAQGELIEPLTAEDLQQIKALIETEQPEAVAINLLFSFLDESQEKKIEEWVPDEIFCSRSSEILPELREYERGMATWLNAWVGPLVKRYLQRLKAGVDGATLTVMQSSGGTMGIDQAGERAVNLLLSGPAGGLAGAKFMGEAVGRDQLLTFDMGGTSTDVAMIDGEITMTSEGKIGRYPVAVPMVDMHTIGAGGGSIAYVDAGGLLQVGPESAGANPGPACYGQGGTRPTVTDANLVLGRLKAEAFLGGQMRLDMEAARAAIQQQVAQPLGITIEEAASGIIRIANEHMARALRVISVQRGVDPRAMTLASFGGAGGLHVCALAEALGMKRAMVPMFGGVLSAFGMLVAPRSRRLSHAMNGLFDPSQLAVMRELYATLQEEGEQSLREEGVSKEGMISEYTLDLRYQGQSYYLNVAWQDEFEKMAAAFHAEHQQRYGHQMPLAIEVVNLRLHIKSAQPLLQQLSNSMQSQQGEGKAISHDQGVLHVEREQLAIEEKIVGPAMITELVATTYLQQGWWCYRDNKGNLQLGRD